METVSFILQCWQTEAPDVLKLKVTKVVSGQAVQIREGIFLVRLSIYSDTIQRCYIRHLSTGREAHLQIGASLREFIRECLLSETLPTEQND